MADANRPLLITGQGDAEPEDAPIGIGSGGNYALGRCPRALLPVEGIGARRSPAAPCPLPRASASIRTQIRIVVETLG